MKIDLTTLSVLVSITTFLIGVISAISIRHARDALTKNNLGNRVSNLEVALKNFKTSEDSQVSNILENRENILKLQEKHGSLSARIMEFQAIQREEINDIKLIQTDTTKAIVQLEATLKGLSKLIESKL